MSHHHEQLGFCPMDNRIIPIHSQAAQGREHVDETAEERDERIWKAVKDGSNVGVTVLRSAVEVVEPDYPPAA
jgi:hypothetical protein